MRSFSLPLPTLFAGFVAVLVGYASSAAIIWQAAAALPRADRRLDDGSWPRHGHQYSRAERPAESSCAHRPVNAGRCAVS